MSAPEGWGAKPSPRHSEPCRGSERGCWPPVPVPLAPPVLVTLSPSSRSWGMGDRVGFGAPQELPPGHCCLQGSSCMERLSPGSPSLRHQVSDMVLGTGRRMGTAPCPLGTAKVVAFGEFLQSWRISLVPSGSVGGAERIWHRTGGWWWWWGHIPPGRRQHRCQHVVAMAICFCRGPSGRLLLFIILIWPQSPLLEVDWDVCPPGRAKGDVHTSSLVREGWRGPAPTVQPWKGGPGLGHPMPLPPKDRDQAGLGPRGAGC